MTCAWSLHTRVERASCSSSCTVYSCESASRSLSKSTSYTSFCLSLSSWAFVIITCLYFSSTSLTDVTGARHYINNTHIHTVSQYLPSVFITFFLKRLGIFCPNFTCLLCVPIYAGLQIFIQLTATSTTLCHNKCDHDHMLKMSTIGSKRMLAV